MTFAAVTVSIPDSDLDRAWAWGDYDSEGIRFAHFRTYEDIRTLAVRLATERASQGPALTTAQRILGLYHQAYRDLQAVCLGLDTALIDQAPAPEEWSIREALSHIVQTDTSFFVVARYGLLQHRQQQEPELAPEAYWEATLGKEDALNRILDGPPDTLRSYYDSLHSRILSELLAIRDDELPALSYFWESTPFDMRFRLHRFDSHLRQHTIQIEKTRVQIGHPPSEAQRLLRLIYTALAEVENATIDSSLAQQELAATIIGRAEELARILSPPAHM